MTCPRKRAPEKREIADNVENLVPNKFVGKPQRFFAEHSLAAHDDGVLETPALDQVFLHQRLDLLVIDKRPGRRDFAFVDRRRDFGREILRKPIVRPGLSAGDTELFIRQDNQKRAAFCLDVHRLVDTEKFSGRILRDNTGSLDHVDIRLRAAVTDRRFVRVHLDGRIVHPHGGERRENVLDGVHPDRPFANRRGALDHFQIVDPGIDRRLVWQIFAFEFYSVVDRRGLNFERHFLAGMQRGAAKPGAFANGMLKLSRGGHSVLNLACVVEALVSSV